MGEWETDMKKVVDCDDGKPICNGNSRLLVLHST